MSTYNLTFTGMPVDDVPRPLSQPQILGRMLDAFSARSGIRRLRIGGPLLSAFESVSQRLFGTSAQIFRTLRARDLDAADDFGLAQLGGEEDAPRIGSAVATGPVDITDTSFTKKSSGISAATFAPIAGSTIIRVDSASGWPATGQIYIGRRTPNQEGPIAYTGVAPTGSYWTLTLAAGTSKFHNSGEEVVVASGGDRPLGRGLVVATSATGLNAAVRFNLGVDTVIPDGETSVTGVPVVCGVPGMAGNVPAAAIQEFPSGAPFPGAVVTNLLPFSSGRDVETNDEYRDRIRAIRNSKQRGTDLAIENAVLNSTGDDDRTASSVTLIRGAFTLGTPDTLYVDDGSGYEEIGLGRGLETVVDSAGGGERDFETVLKPVQRASVVSLNPAPFLLISQSGLSVSVGGTVTTHYFSPAKYPAIQAASSYDVVSDINNDNTLLWSARTANRGRNVVLHARSEINDDIAVVPTPGSDANTAFNFPVSTAYTSLLYLNDELLSKDGYHAVLKGVSYTRWAALVGTQTLQISVDTTPLTTYSITDQHFADLTEFTGVGVNTPEAWATVFNSVIPGITASVENGAVVLTSNLGRSGNAGVEITSGTLVIAGMFVAQEARGRQRDYSLSRGTGQIILEERLEPGDRLTLGSTAPRGGITTPALGPTDLSDSAELWIDVDGDAEVVPHGIGAGSVVQMKLYQSYLQNTLLSFGTTVDNGAANPFLEVLGGDQMVISDPAAPEAWRRSWRVVDAVSEFASTTQTRYSVLIEKPGEPRVGRARHTACLIPQATGGAEARVLYCGGYTTNVPSTATLFAGNPAFQAPTERCEIWDPNIAVWTDAAKMSVPRADHTATTMLNGLVLVTGGYGSDGLPLSSTEIYNPATNTWSAGPVMSGPRAEHTATLLNSGFVLIVGGAGTLTTSQEFNPGTSTFTSTATLGTGRRGHSATLLPAGAGSAGAEAGNVLICGGYNSVDVGLASTERYSASGHAWSAKAAMPSVRTRPGAVSFSTQEVMLVGSGLEIFGFTGPADQIPTYTIYNATTNAWTADTGLPNSAHVRDRRESIFVLNGDVYLINVSRILVSARVPQSYRYSGGIWTVLPSSRFEIWSSARAACTAIVTGSQYHVYGGFTFSTNGIGNTMISTAEYGGATGVLDPIYPISTSAVLSNLGLTFIRSAAVLQPGSITAGFDYTAETLATEVNRSLIGGTADTVKTSKLRISTATHETGSLMVIGGDAAEIQVPTEILKRSQPSSFAHAMSDNSDVGMPWAWRLFPVLGTSGVEEYPTGALYVDRNPKILDAKFPYPPAVVSIGLTNRILGLKRDNSVPPLTSLGYPVDSVAQFGDIFGITATTAAIKHETTRTLLTTRSDLDTVPGAYVPIALCEPYSISSQDAVTVVVDRDISTKRFVVPMFRRLKPASNNYSGTSVILDHDASDAAVSRTFGPTYDWNDFTVLTKARSLTHPADASKRVLWRYYRWGAEGEAAILRYTYPTAPNAGVEVVVTLDQITANNTREQGVPHVLIDVKLASGAQKSAQRIGPIAKLGFARLNGGSTGVWDNFVFTGFTVTEAQRASSGVHTRLRLQIPNPGTVATGPQGAGIIVGNVLWFEAATPAAATLFSGAFTVEQVDAFNTGGGYQDIWIAPNILHNGTAALSLTPNPGTVSFDPSGEATLDATVAAGDIVSFSTGIPAEWSSNGAGRIAGAGRQYLWYKGINLISGLAVSPPVWLAPLDPTTAVVVYAGPLGTAATVVAAINALAAAADSRCPVTATVTGTGSGVISLSTWDELNSVIAGYAMEDGVNAVMTTTPGVVPGDPVSITMKKSVSANLAGSNVDWANEDVRIVPVTSADIAQWMNTPAVTGLWTVAEVVTAGMGRHVQISSRTPGTSGSVEVQDGTGNAATAAVQGSARLAGVANRTPTAIVTVRRGEAEGFSAGHGVIIENGGTAAKPKFWDNSTVVTDINPNGTWSFQSVPTVTSSVAYPQLSFRVVGRFVAISSPTVGGMKYFRPDGYALISQIVDDPNYPNTTPISISNCGIFRVVASTSDVVWIENPIAVEETGYGNVDSIRSNYPVPGDIWTIDDDRFGTANKGDWTVIGIDGYKEANVNFYMTVDVSNRIPTPITPVSMAGVVAQVREGVPQHFYKRIATITPNQLDGAFTDIQFDSGDNYSSISESAGSVVRSLDKLEFPSGVRLGIDGYSYATGLIGEANKIVYGDRGDEQGYPGYAASGAEVSVAGTTVRRAAVALALRVRGNPSEAIADRVRSAVASFINSTGPGGVAIAGIVAAAEAVPGITAVSVVYPTYSSADDVIAVAPGSRLRVIDLRQDVKISFVGL